MDIYNKKDHYVLYKEVMNIKYILSLPTKTLKTLDL